MFSPSRTPSFTIGLLVLSLATLASLLTGLTGTSSRVEAFGCRSALLPNGNVNRCLNCHVSTSGGDARNAFGLFIESLEVGCDDFWSPDIARLDSDGDGRTNGEELGDPEGTWKRGDAPPGDPSQVTLPGVPFFRRGDVDGSGEIEITDPILNLRFQFLENIEVSCLDALDFDDSGSIEPADPLANLAYLFLAGAPPAAPGDGDCGEDPTPESRTGVITCESYPAESCASPG